MSPRDGGVRLLELGKNTAVTAAAAAAATLAAAVERNNDMNKTNNGSNKLYHVENQEVNR